MVSSARSAGWRLAGSAGGRRRRCRPAAGYNLAVLVIFVTVLNIAVAAALPRWSQVMQREREQELIFRGLQYAEAIRLFQLRFGRYPVSLEELIEVNPRCIRQLWKDPMTREGAWEPIFVEAETPRPDPGNVVGGSGRDDGRLEADDDDGEDDIEAPAPRRRPRRRGRRGDDEGTRTGPIVGVRSRSSETAIIRFEGGQRHSDWRFTAELINMPAGLAGMENIPRLYSRWTGRPLREGLEPQVDSGLEEADEPTRTRRRTPGRRGRGGRGNGRG